MRRHSPRQDIVHETSTFVFQTPTRFVFRTQEGPTTGLGRSETSLFFIPDMKQLALEKERLLGKSLML